MKRQTTPRCTLRRWPGGTRRFSTATGLLVARPRCCCLRTRSGCKPAGSGRWWCFGSRCCWAGGQICKSAYKYTHTLICVYTCMLRMRHPKAKNVSFHEICFPWMCALGSMVYKRSNVTYVYTDLQQQTTRYLYNIIAISI